MTEELKKRELRCPITGTVALVDVAPGRPKVYAHDEARNLQARLTEVETLVPLVAAKGMTPEALKDLRRRLRDIMSVASEAVNSPGEIASDESAMVAAQTARMSMALLRRTRDQLKDAKSPEAKRWEAALAALAGPYGRVVDAARGEVR